MNSMAKLILNIVEDEEDTFWVLVYFCEVVLETNYLNSMEGVITDQTVLQKILKRRYPNFMDHLNDVGFSLSSITFKWFICLYTICPIKEELKIAIWDFLILGDKMTIFKTAFIFIEQVMEPVFNLNDMDSILELMDKDLGMYVILSGAELAEKIHAMYFSEEMVSLIKLYTIHDIRQNLEKEQVKMIPKKADKCDPDFLVC